MADLPTNMRGIVLAPPPTTKAARKRWLAARRSVLGASDVSTILGLNDWRTPLDVWLERVHPDRYVDEQSEAMEWGIHHEPTIVNAYRRRHSAEFGVHVAPTPGLIQSEQFRWLAATPDRLLLDRASKSELVGLLECKISNRKWDEVPLKYEVQAQVQMGVTGAAFVDLAALFGGNQMPVPTRIEFDPLAWGQIVEATQAWWERHVVMEEPPDPTTADLAALPRVWPGDGSSAEIPRPIVERLLVRDRIKARIRDLEKAADRVELDAKTALGDAVTGWYQYRDEAGEPVGDPIKVASWTRSPRKTFRQKDFEADHPDLAAKYTSTTTGQRFTVHKQIHEIGE